MVEFNFGGVVMVLFYLYIHNDAQVVIAPWKWKYRYLEYLQDFLISEIYN